VPSRLERIAFLGKRWPKPKYGLRQRVWHRFTAIALKAARRWKASPLLILRSLNEWTRYNDKHRSEGAAPSDWRLELFRIDFADLYFAEEFDQLAKGLSKLLPTKARLGSSAEEVVTSIREAGPHSLWSNNGGSFDLERLPATLRPKTITELSLWIDQISPSLISVSYLATPSAALVLAFRRIFEEPSSLDARIGSFSWKYRFAGVGHRPGNLARRRERDELLLAPNAELVRLLRNYCGVGMAMEGPLASVDVLSTDRPLSALPTQFPEGTVAENPTEWQPMFYLLALGREPHRELFRSDWLEFGGVARDDHYQFGGFQLIASKDAFPKDGEEELKGFGFERGVHDVSRGFAPFVALAAFYGSLGNSLSKVRSRLLPIFRAEAKGRTALRNVKRGHLAIAEANGVAFRQDRVWAELTSKPIPPFILMDMVDLKGIGRLKGETLSSAFWKRFEARHKFLEEQLEPMLRAFRELLAYKAMRVNDALQKTFLWLGILGLAIAFAPEDARRAVWDWLEALVSAPFRATRP
jgi:hypothetical protein